MRIGVREKTGVKSCVVICLLCVFLAGCGQEKTQAVGSAVIGIGDIPELWYNVAITARFSASVILIMCVILGLSLMEIFRKNDEIRKWSKTVLVIKIPLFIFLAVHLYCLLYGIFMRNILFDIGVALYGTAQEGIYIEKTGFGDIPEFWYNVGIIIKRWSSVVICGSMLAAMILMEVFRKSNEIKKWALTVLIMNVPVISFVFVFIYCLLYGFFMK